MTSSIVPASKGERGSQIIIVKLGDEGSRSGTTPTYIYKLVEGRLSAPENRGEILCRCSQFEQGTTREPMSRRNQCRASWTRGIQKS